MSSLAFTTTATATPSSARSGFMALLRSILSRLAQRRQLAHERREFEGLGVDILRDLGVSRYEFNSFVVEYDGYAEATRLRVARVRYKRPWI